MDMLQSIYNHLVLPPQLPGEQDENIEIISHEIGKRILAACDGVGSLVDQPWSQAFQCLRVSLATCIDLNTGRLEKTTLLKHFHRLEPNHMLILHVVEQNAALIIRREVFEGQDHVIFEAFEASATSEQVLAADQAMQWDFPGRSAQVPLSVFFDQAFQDTLAGFLEQACIESLHSLQAHAKKTGVSITEARDTTNPALITQLLIPLLEAMGDHFQAPILRKRVRDDVNIVKGNLPWRRLPFWLVLRVASQRHLCLLLGNEQGRMSYKFLMSILFSELLKESAGTLHPELTILLRAKLCRRMAKLEVERTKTRPVDMPIYELPFTRISPVVKDAIENVTAQIDAAWNSFKKATTRKIPRLPLRATDDALRLSLPNSGDYLDRLLSFSAPQRQSLSSLDLPQPLDKTIKRMQEFTDHIHNLASKEIRIRRGMELSNDTAGDHESNDETCKAQCVKLARQISRVFEDVGTTYGSDPEQMSNMILSIFTLWIQLDKRAIEACPILADHRPLFRPEILDVLQLPTLRAMRQLQEIQDYLSERHKKSHLGSILDDISSDCLAVRYVAQSRSMKALGSTIQNASDEARIVKEFEWKSSCREYDEHTEAIADDICCCTWRDGQRDVRGCTKCWHWRVRNRIEIQVHEAFLPAKDPQRSALIFELAIPGHISAYRNATWRIARALTHPDRLARSSAPAIELTDCKPLRPYFAAEAEGISLGSTIKCFQQTHYKFARGKAPLSDIMLPFGANFELYDRDSQLWIRDLREPLTFQRQCGVHIPTGLRNTVIPAVQNTANILEGPSSYQIQANEGQCPTNMSVHEFSACQKLLAGKLRRWPNILVELGSSNLNFSSEDTTRLLCQLAVQAGPESNGEDLRAVHAVFKEPAFLERLADIIEKRLDAISTNWREHNQMELLITLALRIVQLSSGLPNERGKTFLRKARDATLDWTVRLGRETRSAGDAHAAMRAAKYGFCAALLCRRTFTAHADLGQVISSEDLASWVQASIALQENIPNEIEKLPQTMKSMLIRDTKMAHRLWPLLQSAIRARPASIGDGIRMSWTDSSDNVPLTFTEWSFLPQPDTFWVVAGMFENEEMCHSSQVVHCHVLEGHLLVNKKPRGKLPLEIRNDSSVKEIFGDKHLLTYPSPLPGMSHRLATNMFGQWVHFGLRGERVVIRIVSRDGLLEHVPRDIFVGPGHDNFDLPTELLDNCVHWLNLHSKCLEVRRKPEIWKKKMRNWIVNVQERQAIRANSMLVNPQSDLFRNVARAFQYFETPRRLTVFQPQTDYGKLSIELRHLELSFFVNTRGLLECRQLKAEIDPDQDAGTWYGLESKIVLRDVISHKRSIIVPLGNKVVAIRHGMHIRVRTEEAQNYGRYTVDETLNRLSCPPEPWLLYTKALYHAFTSFCLPDPLTGRTGTEEASHILRSGAAQPWTSQREGMAPLIILTSLLPQREYYPPHLKRFQRVKWDPDLTMTVQHDGYESLIGDIIERSSRLAEFDSPETGGSNFAKPTDLRRRGEICQHLYRRSNLDTSDQITNDAVCGTRDQRTKPHAGRVYEIARLVLTSCRDIHLNTRLISILESWKIISGFNSENVSLSHVKPLANQIGDPINEQWGDLVNFSRQAENQFSVLFRLGLLAFAPSPDMDTLRMLAAFSCIDELKSLEQPAYGSFSDFASRGRPSVDVLQRIITQTCSTTRSNHHLRDRVQSQRIATHILSQWPVPAEELSTKSLRMDLIDAPTILNAIVVEWERRRGNAELEDYINQVQLVLDSRRRGPKIVFSPSVRNSEEPAFISPKRSRAIPPTARELVGKNCNDLGNLGPGTTFKDASAAEHAETSKVSRSDPSSEVQELERILGGFAKSPDDLRAQYGTDLLQSLAALKDASSATQRDHGDPAPASNSVANALQPLRQITASHAGQIFTALSANDGRSTWLKLGGIWPCTTPVELLELLRSASCHQFGPGMKEALVEYGLAITSLQRLHRIRNALLRADTRVMSEEIRNLGHQNWSPLEHPDWLLLEIESDILIRPEQVDVARAIIKPASGQNSVIQMNMGKGKTSCIVPMVIAVIADGENLSRLVVPKALLAQTAQMVQSRLGGLVGREICHIPFSRKTRMSPGMLDEYARFHHDTRINRGLVLTSHEHILSYQLSGWQHVADGRLETASTMTKFQRWLNDHCRDVLDECDFTLSVKTQLNYPGGSEMAIDGQPHRWEVAQELLALAADHISSLRDEFPGSIDVRERPGSYPMAHFLKSDMEDKLRDRILDDICAGRANFLRPAKGSFPKRQASVRQALSAQRPDERTLTEASSAFVDPQRASKTLLVVRGLVVNKILLFCLSRRWNVQYGLHPDRDPIAVPFEAKGTPSEQSEFGHPDVAILFTCLSFYYTGLPLGDLRRSVKQVLQSDDPALQYGWWISGCSTLPESLQHWRAINVEDAGQMEEMWKHLRFNRIVVNYHMNNFVFPSYARQFETKLQASAWDIPLMSKAQHEAKTTGFSGTNDNRMMLPLTIRQDELPSLRQTNAEVLSYLLQRRNRGYQVTTNHRGKRLSESDLLTQLKEQEIRVLIDAGAYILEMDNKTLADTWLKIDHAAKAAIYFGRDSKAWVHYRGEAKSDVPLLATPFADDLSECVVYLDEAHTRGVDLKFPSDAHGALTLAPKQTKDFTMQAAMRLRQLRSTQRVTFFAPPEVDQSIRDCCHPKHNERLDSSHVIAWLLEQTCRGIVDMQGLYVAQGVDFCDRTDAASRYGDFITKLTHRRRLLQILKQPERQTLEQMYGYDVATPATDSTKVMSTPQLQGFLNQLLRSRRTTGVAQTGVFEEVEVEREREVQNQVQQVRQIQRPPLYGAFPFPGLHRALRKFAETGILDLAPAGQTSAFAHAFAYLARTDIGKRHKVHITGSALFVSNEFERTVNVPGKYDLIDNFLRPVEWILWSPSTQTAVVIIPEEAELLIPLFRLRGCRSAVHLIAYAAPVTKTMTGFNEFRYYSLPQLPTHHIFPDWFRVELGILAGRLYVDPDEGKLLTRYFQPSLSNDAEINRLADDPAQFLLEWLSLRRRSQDVTRTPMGLICTGRNPEAGHVL
ncbi:uncharacterized protein F4807DRAFT_25762 [Annulohypoxylon truncatum]|uniref:uncharacterized protein n=1 Tax=Annulohypoxylon truncatum TaxID=327061 RepID=UPI00200747A1|nr:uncharacterized protein F4807DRAFT_25762 [Annulohypoxylon truncatum]KAI1211128.1 hypothetical protein F4807DRAFT_25762 [Annulohypoxylon truncatum]